MAMKNPVHPGEILREDVLGELGLSVGDAAARLGVSRAARATTGMPSCVAKQVTRPIRNRETPVTEVT